MSRMEGGQGVLWEGADTYTYGTRAVSECPERRARSWRLRAAEAAEASEEGSGLICRKIHIYKEKTQAWGHPLDDSPVTDDREGSTRL